MRVTHFAHADSTGGSGRSAYRIHTGLRERGVQSCMIVARKASNDLDVHVINSDNRALHLLDKVGKKVNNRLSLQDVFIPSSTFLPQHDRVQSADVLQIFNTWDGLLSYLALPRLSNQKPIVWRLSDEWLYTGHCVYTYGCDRWQTGCGKCPQVEGERALRRDTSALLWRLKKWAYRHTNMHLVAPSSWIAEQVRKSPLVGHLPVHVIPNGIDTDVYGSIHQYQARTQLNLPPDMPIVLFASHVLDVGRKGGHHLLDALRQLTDINGMLVLLGEPGSQPLDLPDNWQAHHMGYVSDDSIMAAVYAAADVFVLPSLADNLPNTVLESMACGTPVVAFDVGGVSDAVRHMETGYLVPAFNVTEVANGIRQLLHDERLRLRLGKTAQQVARTEYTLDREVEAFLALYKSFA